VFASSDEKALNYSLNWLHYTELNQFSGLARSVSFEHVSQCDLFLLTEGSAKICHKIVLSWFRIFMMISSVVVDFLVLF